MSDMDAAQPTSRVEEWTASLVSGDASPVRQHFSGEGAFGPRVIWSPSAGDLGAAPLRFLHTYWNERSAGRELPCARSVDPLAMRTALGYVAVVEPLTHANDFRYRLFGSIIASVSGCDITGRLVSAHPASAYIVDFYLAVYRAVMLRRCPVATVHRPPASVSMTTWHRLVLPFVDDTGRITRLLAGVVPVRTDGRIIGSPIVAVGA